MSNLIKTGHQWNNKIAEFIASAPVRLKTSQTFGRSLIASRFISPGETIVEEKPWYSIPGVPSEDPAEKFVEQVMRVRHPKFAKDADQSDTWPEFGLYIPPNYHEPCDKHFYNICARLELQEDRFWNQDVCMQLIGRYKSNVLSNPETPSNGEIFALKSLLNHACLPNAAQWPKSGDVFAMVPIEQGQQIVVNYGQHIQEREIDCKQDGTCDCFKGADFPRDSDQCTTLQLIAKIRTHAWLRFNLERMSSNVNFFRKLEQDEVTRAAYFRLVSDLYEAVKKKENIDRIAGHLQQNCFWKLVLPEDQYAKLLAEFQFQRQAKPKKNIKVPPGFETSARLKAEVEKLKKEN